MKMQLRFPLEDIHDLSARYAYQSSGTVIVTEVVPRARRQRFLSQGDLDILCRWKSPRIGRRCLDNPPEFVEAVSAVALSTSNERLRVEVLVLLRGVGWPMASVILHWCHTDPYPILDYRALWSLGLDALPSYYDFDLWWRYVCACREIADQAGVDKRTLDRALWQYSKENQ